MEQTEYMHETIKVPEQFLAWVYVQSENKIDFAARHWHRSLELTYIIEGSVQYYIDGQSFIAKEGDILLINSCDVHGCTANYQGPSDFISIIFPYAFLKFVMPSFNDYRYIIDRNAESFTKLTTEFQEMYPVFKDRASNTLYQLKLNSFFYEILYIIFTECKTPKIVPNSIQSQKHIARCIEILDYIDTHYAENLSLESIAEHFFISKEHLARTFKTYMSTTIKKYVTSIRIHHAYQSLVESDLPILQIALENGFSDARAFSSAFYSYYGETPQKYRKTHKEPSIAHTKGQHLYTRGFL